MKPSLLALYALGGLSLAVAPPVHAALEPEDSYERDDDREDAHEVHEPETRESEDHEATENEEHEDSESEEHEAGEDDDGDSDGGTSHSFLREVSDDEHPDYDEQRFPIVHDEVIGLDLSEHALALVTAQGFAVIDTTRLASLHSEVTRFKVPTGMRVIEAAALLRQIDPHATVAPAHYYVSPASRRESRRTRGPVNHSMSVRRTIRLRIGMIDSSVDPHPMLSATSITRRQFGSNVIDPAGHGTAVASVLAQNGATEILAANVFRGGDGRQFTTSDAIIRGLDWLIGQRVPVINISLAGPRNAVLDTLFARALANGHVIVAAAGNGGPTAPPAYPAALDGVVAVTAVDAQHRVYRYANRGDYIRVSALGVAISAAAPRNMQANYSGTSFAAPLVAAIIARCASDVAPANSRCITAMEATALDLGAPGRDSIYGLGLVR
ncbi:MAG: S8 family serine peptidase [Sphingopyxis sp.]